MAKTTAKKKTSTTSKRRTTSSKKPTTRGGTGSQRKTSTKKKTATTPKKKTTPSKTRRPVRKQEPPSEPAFSFSTQQKALIIGIIFIFLAAILVLSLLSPNQGQLTAAMSDAMWQLFGWGGAIVPFVMGGFGFYLVLWGMDQPPQLPNYRVFGGVLLFLAFEAIATLWQLVNNDALNTVWEIADARTGGGYVGGLLAWIGNGAVGALGAAFLFLLVAGIGVVLVSGVSRAEMGEIVRGWLERERKPREPRQRESVERRIPANPAPIGDLQPARIISSPEEPPPAEEVTEEPKREHDPAEIIRRSRRAKPEPTPTEATPAVIQSNTQQGQWNLPDLATMLQAGSGSEVEDNYLHNQVAIIEETLESFGAPVRLVEVNAGPTVTQFGVEPLYLESRSGRRTKVKVSKVASLADDLALALAAKSVRIQAPVPGKGYIGIEVPNSNKAIVSLRDIMESAAFKRMRSLLKIGLGEDVAGNPVSADLAKMPHLLIAGATGSGKSVCVNGIIACLLLQNTPNDLRFVMVDPKRVELTGYNGIPHLAAPVVVDMDRVVGVLQWALREMDSRYQLFAKAGTRNITSYNKKAAKDGGDKLPYIVIIIDELADLMMTAPEDTERALARLAQMARATGIHMIIATQRPSVDVVTGLIKANFPARIAFAVSSSTDSRVVLDTVGAERLLGQGDMLFQKPDSPAPMRMQGCYVSDEELNALIAYWQSARRFHRYSDRDAVQRVTNRRAIPRRAETSSPPAQSANAPEPPRSTNEPAQMRESTPPPPAPNENGTPSHPATELNHFPDPLPPLDAPIEDFQQPLWEELIEEETKKQNQVDELWDEAVTFVRKSGKASTSMLQRRFRIGYTRAARIIDTMEENAIIGPPTGTSKAREVLPFEEEQSTG